MLNIRNSILLIAVGSFIVIAGIVFYFMEIAGATGMILIGIAAELYGGISFFKSRKKPK